MTGELLKTPFGTTDRIHINNHSMMHMHIYVYKLLSCCWYRHNTQHRMIIYTTDDLNFLIIYKMKRLRYIECNGKYSLTFKYRRVKTNI